MSSTMATADTAVPTPRHQLTSKSTRTPTLAAEGYVNPGGTVAIQLQHVWQRVVKATFKAVVFEGGLGQDYPATITETEHGRLARGEVKIGADTEPGQYEVTAVLVDDQGWVMDYKQWLIIEAKHDGKVTATVTPVDDEGLAQLKVERISKNPGWCDARTKANNGDGESWFGLQFQRGDSTASANVVIKGVKPGTYPIEVRQQFHGGHQEILKGTVTVPNAGPRRAGQSFILDAPIDLSKAGQTDHLMHKITFGKDHKQPDTDYTVDVLVITHGKDGKRFQGKVTREEAKALGALEHPFRKELHESGVILHTMDTHALHGNERFKLAYRITITTADDEQEKSESDGAGAAAAPADVELILGELA